MRCSHSFGTVMKVTRNIKGLTLSDMEPIAGYSYKTIGKVEKGERAADCVMVAALTRGLDSPHLARHYCNHECPVKEVLRQKM